MSDTTLLRIGTSGDEVALEIGYAILGRANDLHDNPDDDAEPVAEELQNIGEEIIERYEEPTSTSEDADE